MPLVQVVCSVLILQASVLAKLDTQEKLVIPVPPTITEQVVDLAKVSITIWKYVLQCFFKCTYSQPVVVIPLVQAVCIVLILQASVLAKLDTQEELVIPVPPTTIEQVTHGVIYLIGSYSEMGKYMIQLAEVSITTYMEILAKRRLWLLCEACRCPHCTALFARLQPHHHHRLNLPRHDEKVSNALFSKNSLKWLQFAPT